MTSTHHATKRVWLTPDAHRRLRAELADLFAVDATPVVGVADEAGDPDGDLRSPARRRQRQERIREIQELLNTAVVGEDPPDDGVAEPGMVLTVRYDDTADTETFLLGMRAAEHGDIEVYSPDSPLGAALSGARRGEQRTYRVPAGGTVRVTLLDAVPYGHHRPAGAP
ncbi:GreA/GreB family elongation factor [Saccharothrix algeriensis]|uniref:Transcription elongation GreA/GreB family factor n=1 Tax=Saccharothrix algeriensis TaxID=173560 RepID=A0ABS2S0X9_9PSEU|nr:GreA/GreB family elongation factor [Saccharothrix algeriensis]MBM7809893.1 transcription elongation GreA/GreB family factor [Saccharothrix algeriensis]